MRLLIFKYLVPRRWSQAVFNLCWKTERRIDFIRVTRQAAQHICVLLLLGVSLTVKAIGAPDSVDANAGRDRLEIHSAFGQWFERFKARASSSELHDFLWSMPKGADLHLHITGSIFPEWWLELALASKAQGYEYFTRVRVNNCGWLAASDSGEAAAAPDAVTEPLYFETIDGARHETLSECVRGEFKSLTALNGAEKAAWLKSIRLDRPGEGRDEFFEKHWQRLGDLTANPYIVAEGLARNALAFAEEGLHYFEPQILAEGYRRPDGQLMPIETSVSIIIDRMKQSDVVSSGIQFRFQQAILRFLPNAEVQLARAFEIVSSQASWVAVNMVGREDNDKGHPRRFLAPIRALRREYPGVALSIHGGEVDEPNSHVRDTLLLGATRIGHAVNLISDEELLQSMRFGPYLVEINLISNLKLEYVPRLDTHPFPEYLRLGVPVALSTDDRGMWDTNITDEFFVAVHHFNLTWDELSALSVASLSHAFLPETTKHEVISRFQAALDDFALEVMAEGVPSPSIRFQKRRAFICENYQVCGNFN